MFTPISLYQIDRTIADDFVSKLLEQFEWFLFLFYGDLRDKSFLLPSDLAAFLGNVTGSKIALVNFMSTTNDFREYLYGDWKDDAPRGLDPAAIRILKESYEKPTSDEERTCLERLFYSYLFVGDRFQPSFAIMNNGKAFFVRRKLAEEGNERLRNQVLEILDLIQENPDSEILSDPLKLGEQLIPSSVVEYNPRVDTNIQNIEKAFSNFLDSAADALDALNPKTEPATIEDLEIRATEKFLRSFRRLSSEIQKRAINTIKDLLKNRFLPGMKMEKITLRNNTEFHRIRFTDSHRIHLIKEPKYPLFINIGAHRLFEFGCAID